MNDVALIDIMVIEDEGVIEALKKPVTDAVKEPVTEPMQEPVQHNVGQQLKHSLDEVEAAMDEILGCTPEAAMDEILMMF